MPVQLTPKPTLSHMSPSIRLSVMLMDSLSTALPSTLLDPGQLQQHITIDSVMHSQVYRIIRANRQYIDDITSRYFKGTQLWLPIISRKLFHDKFMNLQTLQTADFSMLLLSMALVSEYPCAKPEEKENCDLLYHATKSLYTHVQLFVPSSTHLIQAGLLISTYEHGHGMFESAYLSIGTCARMAFAAGLDRTTFEEELDNTEAWSTIEEQRNLWWGIVICDK
jgi:Fungal specific transcription factor domain